MDNSNRQGLRSLFEELKKLGKAHNQTHFAALIGEQSRGNLSNYLNGVKPLGDALAKQYALHIHAKLPEVSHPWVDQLLLSSQPTPPPARQPKSAEAYLEELEGKKDVTALSAVGQRTGERGSEEDEDGNWAKVKEAPGEGQPYYDVDFLGGYGEFVDHPEDARPEYFIDFKPYNRKGVFYVNLRGDSMAPEFNGGDLLALRPVEGWWDYLLMGKVYAIVTKQGQRTIKRLRKGPSPEAYQLEPINPAYDKQDIPKDQIAAVFEVLGGIRHYE